MEELNVRCNSTFLNLLTLVLDNFEGETSSSLLLCGNFSNNPGIMRRIFARPDLGVQDGGEINYKILCLSGGWGGGER